MVQVRFTTELGTEVLVPIEGTTPSALRQAVLDAQREFGGIGWRSCPVPLRGFRFPLASEPDFDWRLLSARRGTGTIDGEVRDGVWYCGQFYTRRALDPNPRMKLERAIKYSRGANGTDPEEIVEGEDGSFRYVTLAIFRGEGRRREEYAIPRATRAEGGRVDRASESRPAEDLPPLPSPDDHEALLRYIREVRPRVSHDATIVIADRRHSLKPYARDHWKEIKEDLPIARQVVNAVATAAGVLKDQAG
jgi:hypothetical protein